MEGLGCIMVATERQSLQGIVRDGRTCGGEGGEIVGGRVLHWRMEAWSVRPGHGQMHHEELCNLLVAKVGERRGGRGSW